VGDVLAEFVCFGHHMIPNLSNAKYDCL